MGYMNRTAGVSAPEIEACFRPIPFWSWNDELEIPELLRQIQEMHEKGIGGFFIHARGGLRTPYMGEKWMACIAACVREAASLGMKPWLYDENGWPSGFGAGAVNGLGIEYQQKDLLFCESSRYAPDGNCRLVACYDSALGLTESPEKAAWCAFFRANPHYVDNMDPEVTGTFIEKIHERYWRELPSDVRSALAGIFTDEPQLSRSGCPWSMILPAEYAARYREDLLPRIPELFLDRPLSARTRIRYYRLCGELFRNNYILKIGNWCREHNWLLTGHHLLEERYDRQVYSSGSVMRQYSGYDIPGNDHLGRFAAYPIADVQVVSIAAQYGRRQIITETFGCSGWNFNMQGMKWLYQQHLVHGINLLCPHLAGYSLRGLRKRDYPASLFEQHPMWEHVKKLNDSFARVGKMLSCGEIECRTLVLHGLSTAWRDCVGGGSFSELTARCNRAFDDLVCALDKSGIPFHIGDEPTLEELGMCKNGLLRVGRMTYSAAVVPPVANFSGKVLRLLREFAAQGGALFSAADNRGRELTRDGELMTPEESDFLEALPVFRTPEELPDLLLRAGCEQLRCWVLEGEPGRIRGTWRSFPEENERWYFIADFASIPERKADDPISPNQYCQNPVDEPPTPVGITLPFPAETLELIDQESGAVLRRFDFAELTGRPCFVTSIPSCGSLLIRAKGKSQLPALDLTKAWQVKGLRNVLTLEKVRFKTPEMGDFSEPCGALALFNRLLGRPDTEVTLRYEFECSADLDPDSLSLALEFDGSARCFLNGSPLVPESKGFFIDRAVRVIKLPAELIRAGKNCFDVRIFFRQQKEVREALERAKHFESEANKLFFDSEVEAVYLLGNFRTAFEGVRTREKPGCFLYDGVFRAAKAPATLDLDGLLDAGLIFFSGKLELEKQITLTAEEAASFSKVVFAPFRADSVTLKVNGRSFPVIFSEPYEADVARMLREGKNLLELTIAVSPRNTLGPLHTLPVEPYGVGPGSFLTETDLLGRVAKSITGAYGFIEPGIRYVRLCRCEK